jgi:hypothetical protein
MQSHVFEDALPWNDREMLSTLTSPEIARQLWRTRGATAENLRKQFDHNENAFLAYVAALVERSNSEGGMAQKVDWRAYQQEARTSKD